MKDIGNGYKEIESLEGLLELKKAADRRYAEFEQEIGKRMTKERATRIRELRVEWELDMRTLAAVSFLEWEYDACWLPVTNYLAGLALCKCAADHLGEAFEH